MSSVYLVLERFFCDTTVIYAYSDLGLAEAQAEWMDAMVEVLGESEHYVVQEVDLEDEDL